MFKFWELVIAPMLRAISAKRLVEIGVDHGDCTRLLLEYCAATRGHLDYVDPCPGFDTKAAQARYGAFSTFHKTISLDALTTLPPADAVLIDGDHNWYTVHRELELLLEKANETGTGFPLVLFHDVSWPYGRRDLYYAPERIPSAHRQPFARKGILPGVSELVDKGGLSQQLCNALREGGPRNGVLTAVEDFVAESKVGTLYVIPILFGLGILVPERLAKDEALMAEINRWQSAEGLQALLELVERGRVAELASLHAENVRLDGDCRQLSARAAELEKTLVTEHTAVLQLYRDREQINGECARLGAEADRQRAEADRLRADLSLILSSASWRLTNLVRTTGAKLIGKQTWHVGNGRNGK